MLVDMQQHFRLTKLEVTFNLLQAKWYKSMTLLDPPTDCQILIMDERTMLVDIM